MRKIPTLFVRDLSRQPALVVDEVTPGCEWVLAGEGDATRKYDGTCVMLDEHGAWWARREVKPGKAEPPGWVEVEADANTGKRVGWEPIDQSPFVKAFREATEAPYDRKAIGTHELCGPKVNGNPEGFYVHMLIWHEAAELLPDAPRDFYDIQVWLHDHPYEGIVWHHPDGRMAKIKRRDFPR
jgi:hypothetical protein